MANLRGFKYPTFRDVQDAYLKLVAIMDDLQLYADKFARAWELDREAVGVTVGNAYMREAMRLFISLWSRCDEIHYLLSVLPGDDDGEI